MTSFDIFGLLKNLPVFEYDSVLEFVSLPNGVEFVSRNTWSDNSDDNSTVKFDDNSEIIMADGTKMSTLSLMFLEILSGNAKLIITSWRNSIGNNIALELPFQSYL